MTLGLAYLLGGCCSALVLSIHGRCLKGIQSDLTMAGLVVLIWPILWFFGAWDLFDRSLMAVDITTDAEDSDG